MIEQKVYGFVIKCEIKRGGEEIAVVPVSQMTVRRGAIFLGSTCFILFFVTLLLPFASAEASFLRQADV